MEDLLYKLNKTPQDVDALLAIHKKLAYHMLHYTGQMGNQDAESAAWQGLWDAINTFDIFSTTQFSTYACKVIKHAIWDTIRKEQAKKVFKYTSVDFTAWPCDIDTVNYDENGDIKRIYDLFAAYVKTKQGKVKDVLLAWYAADFESSATNIAAIANTSPSYVSRVQNAFRAYIDTQLKY